MENKEKGDGKRGQRKAGLMMVRGLLARVPAINTDPRVLLSFIHLMSAVSYNYTFSTSGLHLRFFRLTECCEILAVCMSSFARQKPSIDALC